MPSQPSISSPATSPSPLVESFKVGQQIAFIYSRTDLVTGIIQSLNHNGTYDLYCNIPMRVRKLKMDRGNPNIYYETTLDTRPFLQASPIDPRIQVIKSVKTLEQIGVPLPGLNSLIQQSSTMTWVDSGHKQRIPRLTEFLAPLVGHFFDPALFYYKITCWRAPINLRGQGVIPEETRIFPDPLKKPYYTSFDKCFSRYVKEYHNNPEKWNRVLMEVILPEDVLPKPTEGE